MSLTYLVISYICCFPMLHVFSWTYITWSSSWCHTHLETYWALDPKFSNFKKTAANHLGENYPQRTCYNSVNIHPIEMLQVTDCTFYSSSIASATYFVQFDHFHDDTALGITPFHVKLEVLSLVLHTITLSIFMLSKCFN